MVHLGGAYLVEVNNFVENNIKMQNPDAVPVNNYTDINTFARESMQKTDRNQQSINDIFPKQNLYSRERLEMILFQMNGNISSRVLSSHERHQNGVEKLQRYAEILKEETQRRKESFEAYA